MIQLHVAQLASGIVLPEQLAQQASHAIRQLLAEAAEANTTHSYAGALHCWAGWHGARYGLELSAERRVEHLVQRN